ncbi:MAG: hypothetical protein HY913_00815 [Desulfomonile tiedjei]|nr:hypothetical protein [Desulfomonile tiedjei]
MTRLISGAISLAIMFSALMATSLADKAAAAGPVKAGLPAELFIAAAPPNAIDVGDARKSAVEGKPIVVRGQVGGLAKPFADKYAMFVVCDKRLAVCPSGCANPTDFCSVPREQLMANLATIQVVDQKGLPLKLPLQGLNGLRPLSEVVIQGTVAKTDNNVLIVNAHNIYVNNKISLNP